MGFNVSHMQAGLVFNHSSAPSPAVAQAAHLTTEVLVQRTPSVIQKLLMNWDPGRRCAVRSAKMQGRAPGVSLAAA